MAGMAGFEPTNARVKVWCLTAWRHPNIGSVAPWPDTLSIIAWISCFGNPYFHFCPTLFKILRLTKINRFPHSSQRWVGNYFFKNKQKSVAKQERACYNVPCVRRWARVIGMSPSGKAQDFDSGIRRFKSCHPSHTIR